MRPVRRQCINSPVVEARKIHRYENYKFLKTVVGIVWRFLLANAYRSKSGMNLLAVGDVNYFNWCGIFLRKI